MTKLNEVALFFYEQTVSAVVLAIELRLPAALPRSCDNQTIRFLGSVQARKHVKTHDSEKIKFYKSSDVRIR